MNNRNNNGSPELSCEIFPPKKDGEFERVFEIIDRIAECKPAFISVTYGAGGSNAGKAIEISSYIQNQTGITALSHLTSVGFSASALREELKALKEHNITSILALRGDRPQAMSDEQFNSRDFEHASDMIRFLREEEQSVFQSSLTIAGGCYPECHPEAKSFEADLEALLTKQQAGCDMLISQLFFENDRFYSFLDAARAKGITLPVHAGIMPITSANQLGRTVTLSGTHVAKELLDLIDRFGDQPEEMKKAGVDFAVRQALDLKERGVDGIHVYAMNKPELCEALFNALRG
ncbi:MAG: methylenetetrahydrofolate reductase [Lachnospiraceae bacterium]|nr:methylenetetrahydrofolate reductase [Lachnospiraceae bacterium]